MSRDEEITEWVEQMVEVFASMQRVHALDNESSLIEAERNPPSPDDS